MSFAAQLEKHVARLGIAGALAAFDAATKEAKAKAKASKPTPLPEWGTINV